MLVISNAVARSAKNRLACGRQTSRSALQVPVPVVPTTSEGGRVNRRFLMRALRNRLEKIAGSQSAWADQDPAERICGTASPGLPV